MLIVVENHAKNKKENIEYDMYIIPRQKYTQTICKTLHHKKYHT